MLVCDVAIGRVRAEIAATVSGQDRIRYTLIDGQGTLVAEPRHPGRRTGGTHELIPAGQCR